LGKSSRRTRSTGDFWDARRERKEDTSDEDASQSRDELQREREIL
jgi:hypothetical protein